MGIRAQAKSSLRRRKTAGHAVTVNTDNVVPFHFVDNLKAWRIGISVNTFRFDSRMDPEKLRAALQRLYEMEGWKKLGARIRKTTDVSGHCCRA